MKTKPSIMANRDIVSTRKLAEDLKDFGRKGDNEIREIDNRPSHVNALEAYLIDIDQNAGEKFAQTFGSGTTNPVTGLKEYHTGSWFHRQKTKAFGHDAAHWKPKDFFDGKKSTDTPVDTELPESESDLYQDNEDVDTNTDNDSGTNWNIWEGADWTTGDGLFGGEGLQFEDFNLGDLNINTDFLTDRDWTPPEDQNWIWDESEGTWIVDRAPSGGTSNPWDKDINPDAWWMHEQFEGDIDFDTIKNMNPAEFREWVGANFKDASEDPLDIEGMEHLITPFDPDFFNFLERERAISMGVDPSGEGVDIDGDGVISPWEKEWRGTIGTTYDTTMTGAETAFDSAKDTLEATVEGLGTTARSQFQKAKIAEQSAIGRSGFAGGTRFESRGDEALGNITTQYGQGRDIAQSRFGDASTRYHQITGGVDPISGQDFGEGTAWTSWKAGMMGADLAYDKSFKDLSESQVVDILDSLMGIEGVTYTGGV